MPCSLEEFYRFLGTALIRSISLDDPSGDWVLDRAALQEAAGDRADGILRLAIDMGVLSSSRYRALAAVRFGFRHALLRDHFAYPAAIAVLSAGSQEEGLLDAVRALGRIGGTGATAKLMEVAAAEGNAAAARAALRLATLATIIYSRTGGIAELAERLTESTGKSDDIMIRSYCAIILMGGGDPARKLIDLLEQKPVPLQTSLGEHVRRMAHADFIRGTIQMRRLMMAADYESLQQRRPSSGRRKESAARSHSARSRGSDSKSGVTVSFGSGRTDGGFVKILIDTLESGHSTAARAFALRWLAHHDVRSARAAFLGMTRAEPPLSHLGVLGLGLLGEHGDAKKIIGYARKADSVGRACALTSLIKLRNGRWQKHVGTESWISAIWETAEEPPSDETADTG